MNISVCDDERKMAEDIGNIVKEVLPEACVRLCCSGGALLESFSECEPDIVFLDIDMPDMSGLDVAEELGDKLRKKLLIFVTAHDELVYDSLRYHPFAFVRKKYMRNELTHAIADCVKELAARDRRFHFRAGGDDVTVPLADIRYLEAEGNYLILHGEDESTYRFRSTMTTAEDTLAAEGFIRIHKGFLVNASCVRVLRQEEVQLMSGETLPMGKLYAKSAKEQIINSMH